jgi:hypothetical protein
MAGMVAAAVMALFAMVAAAASLDLGFYTPLYQVTATVEPGPLLVSTRQAAAGSRFYLELGPALAGAAVHLMIGAGFGAVFALLVRALRLRGLLGLAAGAGYGLAVMALMGLVLLPAVADQTAGGQLIAEVPDTLGWPVFAGEHLLYGLALGVLLALRPSTAPRAGTPFRNEGRGPGPASSSR